MNLRIYRIAEIDSGKLWDYIVSNVLKHFINSGLILGELIQFSIVYKCVLSFRLKYSLISSSCMSIFKSLLLKTLSHGLSFARVILTS